MSGASSMYIPFRKVAHSQKCSPTYICMTCTLFSSSSPKEYSFPVGHLRRRNVLSALCDQPAFHSHSGNGKAKGFEDVGDKPDLPIVIRHIRGKIEILVALVTMARWH